MISEWFLAPIKVAVRRTTIRIPTVSGDELERLNPNAYGPSIERHELFPNRTNVSFWRRVDDHEIRARIFEFNCPGKGAVRIVIASAVGERIRRHVQNAHDEGALAEKERAILQSPFVASSSHIASSLFISQAHDGIEIGGAVRRIVSEENPDSNRHRNT